MKKTLFCNKIPCEYISKLVPTGMSSENGIRVDLLRGGLFARGSGFGVVIGVSIIVVCVCVVVKGEYVVLEKTSVEFNDLYVVVKGKTYKNTIVKKIPKIKLNSITSDIVAHTFAQDLSTLRVVGFSGM